MKNLNYNEFINVKSEDSEKYEISNKDNQKKTISKVRLVQKREQTDIPQTKITNPNSIAKLSDELENLPYLDREHMLILYLNHKHMINGYTIESIGVVNGAILNVGQILKGALYHNAYKIAMVHNHPTGNTEPSNEDMEVTLNIVDAGKMLGIELLDHVIVGTNEYDDIEHTSLRRLNSNLFI